MLPSQSRMCQWRSFGRSDLNGQQRTEVLEIQVRRTDRQTDRQKDRLCEGNAIHLKARFEGLYLNEIIVQVTPNRFSSTPTVINLTAAPINASHFGSYKEQFCSASRVSMLGETSHFDLPNMFNKYETSKVSRSDSNQGTIRVMQWLRRRFPA